MAIDLLKRSATSSTNPSPTTPSTYANSTSEKNNHINNQNISPLSRSVQNTRPMPHTLTYLDNEQEISGLPSRSSNISLAPDTHINTEQDILPHFSGTHVNMPAPQTLANIEQDLPPLSSQNVRPAPYNLEHMHPILSTARQDCFDNTLNKPTSLEQTLALLSTARHELSTTPNHTFEQTTLLQTTPNKQSHVNYSPRRTILDHSYSQIDMCTPSNRHNNGTYTNYPSDNTSRHDSTSYSTYETGTTLQYNTSDNIYNTHTYNNERTACTNPSCNEKLKALQNRINVLEGEIIQNFLSKLQGAATSLVHPDRRTSYDQRAVSSNFGGMSSPDHQQSNAASEMSPVQHSAADLDTFKGERYLVPGRRLKVTKSQLDYVTRKSGNSATSLARHLLLVFFVPEILAKSCARGTSTRAALDKDTLETIIEYVMDKHPGVAERQLIQAVNGKCSDLRMTLKNSLQ